MLFEKADGIIDLRSKNAFKACHIIGSTWLGLEILPESLNALPASPANLFLVGDKDQIEAASMLLDSKGYSVSGSLAIDSDESIQAWQKQMPTQFETGNVSKTLWQPCSLVAEFIQAHQNAELSFAHETNRPEVLDIGCGGGRDAIYLARNKMNVTAIDHEAKVLKRSKQLAELSGAQVKFKCCDIRKQNCLPESQFDLITMVRFLNRDVFSFIKESLNPGGFVLIQTFVEGVESFKSPKNPNFILKKGELAENFAGFKVITDRIDTIEDGRPVNSFIAQKPSH